MNLAVHNAMSVIRSSVSRMAPELWLHILHHFVPSGAPTTAAIQSSRPDLRPHVLEYRRTLWAACLVSRQVGTIAKVCLYKAVLINSCNELLYFFRTLRTVPALRLLVRSFYWTGTLPQSDADDVECVDLMPSLTAVFEALPPPSSPKTPCFTGCCMPTILLNSASTSFLPSLLQYSQNSPLYSWFWAGCYPHPVLSSA